MSQTNLNQFPGTKEASDALGRRMRRALYSERDVVRKCPKCEKWAFKPTNIGRSRWECGKCGHVQNSKTYKRKPREKMPVGVIDEDLAEESRKQKKRSLEIQKMRMER